MSNVGSIMSPGRWEELYPGVPYGGSYAVPPTSGHGTNWILIAIGVAVAGAILWNMRK